MIAKALSVALAFLSSQSILSINSPVDKHCDTPQDGYQCATGITHFLGHYSPYFTVPSEIPPQVPPSCRVTFVQALSRHGARYPTARRWKSYRQTIAEIQANVTSFQGAYTFLSDYVFALGKEQLTPYGEQEMINSGMQFAGRYKDLALASPPFVRSGSSKRVVRSAERWIEGYQQELNDTEVVPILVIQEGSGSNNTLNHGLCTNFERGAISGTADNYRAVFAQTFVPEIQRRLNTNLPGAKLTMLQTINLMDLCAYDTVASPGGDVISPFCFLFSTDELHSYNYYQTLEKYYGRGLGNPLGPTQGVGFVNELLARMTNTSVIDNTSSNHTLDSNQDTFPLGNTLYADFSHDNDMTSIFFALGLYNETGRLSKHTMSEPNSEESLGYSASWTVPFAARAYFEKMQCQDKTEELVRVIINDRVVPLVGCGADSRGTCTLSKFVASQSFAKGGGRWGECFS